MEKSAMYVSCEVWSKSLWSPLDHIRLFIEIRSMCLRCDINYSCGRLRLSTHTSKEFLDGCIHLQIYAIKRCDYYADERIFRPQHLRICAQHFRQQPTMYWPQTRPKRDQYCASRLWMRQCPMRRDLVVERRESTFVKLCLGKREK